MDFMNYFGHPAVRQWAAEFLTVLFLVAGFVILVVGVSLVLNSAGTLRFFTGMNRWVSTRRSYRTVEVPRDTRESVLKYRRWLAVVFIAGGLFALYGLTMRYDARAAVQLFGLGIFKASFAGWLVDSACWVLIVGNLAAIVVGVMLAFFPDALVAIEARGARWYSERQFAKDRESMNLTLDAWVARYPRAAGCTIVLFALALLGAFGLMAPAVFR
jgi:hypothetical protein